MLTEDTRGCPDQFPPTAELLILLQKGPKLRVNVTGNYSYAEFCEAFSSPFGDWSLVCTVVVTRN